MAEHFKDEGLDQLALQGYNVAQFVSYDPDGNQRYALVAGHPPHEPFPSIEAATDHTLRAATTHAVSVRSYHPGDPKSREFLIGLGNTDEVAGHVRRLGAMGLYTIVNEAIGPEQRGVAGVLLGGVVEFSPNDTPRCVERPGTAQLPANIGFRILEKVYGFMPALDDDPQNRLEFSMHPERLGFLKQHTLVWEQELIGPTELKADMTWPNNFSKIIGDKTYGLLIADTLLFPVPRTTVISREIAPFTFGTPTGAPERWLRTSPCDQTPGLFTTRKGWDDLFRLMATEDPDHTKIAAVLGQDSIDAQFSGAVVAQADGEPLLEGTAGNGDDFMLGLDAPTDLPDRVRKRVLDLYEHMRSVLGPVRFEWVHDGSTAWIVQLHKGATATVGSCIYPGGASDYHTYHTADGIEGLRALIKEVGGSNTGIILRGPVGVTSHFGDLLRKAQIPSRLER